MLRLPYSRHLLLNLPEFVVCADMGWDHQSAVQIKQMGIQVSVQSELPGDNNSVLSNCRMVLVCGDCWLAWTHRAEGPLSVLYL